MNFVELAFLYREEFTYNRRQAIKVIAMKSLWRLDIEELVLIEHEVVLNDASINSNRDKVLVFLLIPALKDAGQEDALLLFFYHLH